MSRLKPEVLTKASITDEGRTVSIEVWRVTPTFARQELMKSNIGNRSMKPLQIARLKRDILQGHWVTLSGECVLYDENNQLINGQNRFQAIADSGEAVNVVVWRNLAPDVKFVLDQNVKRNGADVLWYAGVEAQRSTHATALRIVAAWDEIGEDGHRWLRYSVSKTSRFNISPSDLLDIHKQHPDLAESVAWASSAHRTERCRVIPTGALAFLHYITMRVDEEAADEFWNGYASNDFPNANGDPRWAMWKRLSFVHENKSHNKVTGIYPFVGFRAWNLWRDGQQVNQILYFNNKTSTGPRGGVKKEEIWYEIPEPH